MLYKNICHIASLCTSFLNCNQDKISGLKNEIMSESIEIQFTHNIQWDKQIINDTKF